MKLYKNLHSALKEKHEVKLLKLNLTSKNLPPEIFEFSHLRELYLEGACEEFSCDLSALKELNLLSIQLPHFKGVISPVFELPQLKNLKIDGTPLNEASFNEIKIQVDLRYLTIKNAHLKKIPEKLSKLTQIEEMNLSGNELSSLPDSFLNFKKLKRLNLDSNQFKIFPDKICLLPQLHHLSLDNNPFPEEEKHRIQRDFNLQL